MKSIDQIQEEKNQLVKTILLAIDNFHANNEVIIESIDISFIGVYETGNPNQIDVNTLIRIKISL